MKEERKEISYEEFNEYINKALNNNNDVLCEVGLKKLSKVIQFEIADDIIKILYGDCYSYRKFLLSINGHFKSDEDIKKLAFIKITTKEDTLVFDVSKNAVIIQDVQLHNKKCFLFYSDGYINKIYVIEKYPIATENNS